MKILGTVINTNLSWDGNCAMIIKKVKARMQLLRTIDKFGASRDEMVQIWFIFCRSVLEQSCVVWHSSLTKENTNDLERCQKTFTKLVLKDKYQNYENALLILNLDSLESRRQVLCTKFAKDGIKHNKMNELFLENTKKHNMETRKNEKYVVNFAHTERLEKLKCNINAKLPEQ